MVTFDQAVRFLEKILQMPPSWRELKERDPLQFLTIYMKRHAIRVPFQGIQMAGKHPEHRWFPSEQDYVNQGMTGQGGCCIHLNYFSMLVLRAIGMDSFVVRGDHYCAPIAGTHCILMVKLHGPKDSGVYMVELGGCYPILEPIPMDSEKLPYKTLQAAGFPYEFRALDHGWIGKFHLEGGVMGGKFIDKTEVLRTAWNLKPRALWEFDYPCLETFTNPTVSALLKWPGMYRFFNNSEFSRLFPELPENQNIKESKLKSVDPNKITKNRQNDKTKPLITLISTEQKTSSGKAKCEAQAAIIEYDVLEDDDLEDPHNFIYVWKRRIVIGDAKSRKIIKNYESYEEMGEDLKKFFPMIPTKDVDKAIQVYNGYEVKYSPYDAIL